MVRCSIKRAIKTISVFIILIVIFKKFPAYSRQSDVVQLKLKSKSPVIVILSFYCSKTIPRVILFLNELRLSYIEYKELDQNLYHNLLNDIPSLIIVDHVPNSDFYMFTNQYHISLLILLNNNCENCIFIKYSQMLFENVTYPTIDFNREELKPILHRTTSPFQIQQPNKVIKILRFEKILPYFHPGRNNRCFSLETSKDDSINTIVYVQNKITFEKINLMIIKADKQIYLSECLYHHWFIWPLMMDILRYLTSDVYDYHGLKRYIQIDIDDIFLGGKSNDYLRSNDIHALLRSQLFIQNYIKNFRYRLGFSGYYYQNSGNNEENEGNRLLISKYCYLQNRVYYSFDFFVM
jgi:hypothetical protein